MAKKTPKKPTDAPTTVPASAMPSSPMEKIQEPTVSSSPAPETNGARAKTAKKPEIVATQSRANVFPINLDEEIRRLAYLLSERRGFVPGYETEDWLNAERQVLQRYHQTSA